jgi:hypothetical protein
MSGSGWGGTSGPEVPAPGWYPDPDGAPGRVRWWNGAGWSDVTTPAGPGVSVGRPFEPVASPEPALSSSSWEAWGTSDDADDPGGRPRPPGRRRLLLGLGALGAVLLLALAAVVLTGAGSDGDAGPAPVAGPSSGPSNTFPPGTVRIVDEAAGISYPFLGDGWLEWDRPSQDQTTETAGQYLVTQEDLPDGFDDFIAQCTSGPLVPEFGYAGASTLQSTVTAVAADVRRSYYPGPNEQEVRRDEAVTVDGASAWLYEFELSWDVAGYDASGERAALLLIDVGTPTPALLYLSIPNTHAELYGVIDRVLDDIDVL